MGFLKLRQARGVYSRVTTGFYEGIDNLFKIYMPIVDTWVLVNNSETPRSIVATGGKDQETVVRNYYLFSKIEEYVKR